MVFSEWKTRILISFSIELMIEIIRVIIGICSEGRLAFNWMTLQGEQETLFLWELLSSQSCTEARADEGKEELLRLKECII